MKLEDREKTREVFNLSIRLQTELKEEIRKAVAEYMKKQRESEVVLFEDQIKIAYSCINYPMGSRQIGNIAELSGKLYGVGIDVERMLEKELNRRKKRRASNEIQCSTRTDKKRIDG